MAKIGVVLAVDGEKAYKAGLANANKETQKMKSEINKLTAEYEGNANSLEFLGKKQELLKKQTEAYGKKVKSAADGLKNAQEVSKKAKERQEQLTKALKEAQEAQEKLSKEGKEGTQEHKALTKSVEDHKKALEKQELELTKCQGKVTEWETKISDAQGQLKKANNALELNEKYLEEARQATDHCAKSIDEFGNAAEKTAEVTTKTGDKLLSAFANKAVSMGMDALTEGAQEIKEAMLEVGKADAQLAASTGLSEASAKRYQKVMRQIRGDNFGEDYSDVADTISQVIQILGELNEADMTHITESAITLRDTFGMDVNETIRAVDVMVNTMGVDAGKALDLITTGAQNGLNRSNELTDNLTEYGQLWGQAGFSAEEAFAIMENGLNAGAYNLDKVNDYVKELGISLSDGRVEDNLDSFSKGTQKLFSEWKNGNATTRDVFYSIIDDLSRMENQQAALTLASNVWSALGEDNSMQVITALNAVNDKYNACTNAAQNLADVKYDNVASKMEGLGAAIQENIITPIADAATPAISGLLDGVTTAITTIANSLDPDKTKLEEWIDGIDDANSQLESAVKNGEKVTQNAQLDASKLQTLGGQLIALNGIEDKSLAQKYQLNEIVEQLGESIPEIAAAYDKEAGKVTLTNDAIQDLIGSTQELMIAQAAQAAMQETVNALVQAEIDLNNAKTAKAAADDRKKLWEEEKQLMWDLSDAVENGRITQEDYALSLSGFWKNALDAGKISIDEFNDAIEQIDYSQYNNQMDKTLSKIGEMEHQSTKAGEGIQELENNVASAQKQAELYSESAKKTVKALTEQEQAQKKAKKQTELAKDAQKGMIPSLEETAKAVTQGVFSLEKLGEAAKESAKEQEEAFKASEQAAKAGADAQKEALQSMLDAYKDTVETIKSDVQDKINPFDKFDGGKDITVEEMLKNLESQTAGIAKYKENLKTITEEMGDEIAPEFLRYIQSMGIDGANMLEHMVVTLNQSNGKDLIRQMSNEYVASMNMSEEIAKAGAANEIAYKAAMKELGSTDIEFGKLKDSITSAINDAAGNTESAWGKITEAERQELNNAIETAQECGAKIPEGLAEAISSGETTPAEAIAQITGSTQGAFDALVKIAQENGIAVTEDLASGIQDGGQNAVDAYNSLIQMLADVKSDAEAAGTETGEAAVKAYSGSMENGADSAGSAGSAMAKSAADSAEEEKSGFTEAGKNAASQYASGITASAQLAASSAGNMAKRAVAAARSWQNSFNTAGYYMAAGVAAGISTGASQAVNAAANMARSTLAAAKKELEIRSPSGKFKKEVGKQISAGMAFGIKDNAKLATKEANEMSEKVFQKATSWLKKYKSKQKVSLNDEEYFWQQVISHTKKGTTGYEKAVERLLKKQTDGMFGVSKKTKTGKKSSTKDTQTYYSEVFSEAEKTMRNYSLIYDVSEKTEQTYWENVRKKLKKGTQAWYDATEKINNIKNKIATGKTEAVEARMSVQDKMLDGYKIYYKISAKAEVDYWDIARKQFKTGTKERMETDAKYFGALEELNEKRKALDEEYAENAKEINEELIESVKDLENAYKDAVASRKKDILSQMDLFEAWDSTGYDADTLIYNLKTQVAGLALWEKQLEDLEKKGVSKTLLEELKEMGPDAAASIYSLNQMTSQQLKEYQKLWDEKNMLAESQAVKENEGLRTQTNKEIETLRKDAQQKLNSLNKEYTAAVKELTTGISKSLKDLANNAKTAGEDTVAGLIAGIRSKTDAKSTYKSTTKTVDKITKQLSALEKAGKTIGQNTLDGILKALTNEKKIKTAAAKSIKATIKAMKDEAEIKSPSKKTEREVGSQITAGNAKGIEKGTKLSERSARNMVKKTIDAAKEETHQINLPLPINRAMKEKQEIQIANAGRTSSETIEQMTEQIARMINKIETLKIVLDTGETVGALSGRISEEMAVRSLRNTRGRL